MNDNTPESIESGQGAPSLDNVVVVLSRTTEPMNIGAACRAMKTMGLKHLRLIDPLNPKGRSARALAHGAEDILDNAQVVGNLNEAISDALVITGQSDAPVYLEISKTLLWAQVVRGPDGRSTIGQFLSRFVERRTSDPEVC